MSIEWDEEKVTEVEIEVPMSLYHTYEDEMQSDILDADLPFVVTEDFVVSNMIHLHYNDWLGANMPELLGDEIYGWHYMPWNGEGGDGVYDMDDTFTITLRFPDRDKALLFKLAIGGRMDDHQ